MLKISSFLFKELKMTKKSIKKRGILVKSKSNKNDRLYSCDQPDCDRKFKLKGNLKKHQWQSHDIPSMKSHRFYSCDQSDCDHKFKTKGELKSHKWQFHDIPPILQL